MNDNDIKELFEGVNLKHHERLAEIMEQLFPDIDFEDNDFEDGNSEYI